MNKKIIAIGILALVIFFTSESSAFLTDTNVKENDFTFGSNIVQIEEIFDIPEHYQANTSYRKQVSVNNNGTILCYVRVFAEPSNSEIPVDIDYDTSNWIKNGDYWYYAKILEAGESTSPLFSSVKIGDVSDDDKEKFDVIVYSESVQAYGFNSSLEAFEGVAR